MGTNKMRKKENNSHGQIGKDMYGTWEWSLFPQKIFDINHKLSMNLKEFNKN